LKKTVLLLLSWMLMFSLLAACSGGGSTDAGNNGASGENASGNDGGASNGASNGTDNNGSNGNNDSASADNGLIPDVKGELSILVVLSQLNGADPDLGGVYDYFKTYYPDLKLKQMDIVHEEYAPEKLTEAIAAGNTPDVFVTVPGDIPDLIRKDYIMPIDDLLAANPQYVDTLNPAVINMNKVDGKTYGITWMTLPQTWMLNTDLFEKMGVPVPTDDWTIDEFIEINKQLVDKANGITGSQPDVHSPWPLFSWLEAYGVKGYKMVDGKPVSNFAEDPNAIKAIEKWIEYAAKSNIAFTPEELSKFGLTDPWSAYWTKGHVGMVPWSLWGQPYNHDTKSNNFNWTVLRQPQGPAGRAAIAYGITLAIFPTTEKKDLAMKYIQIVTSKHFYDNALMKDPTTGNESPLTIRPDDPDLPIGIPAINENFQSTPENQAALDGFVRSMQDAKIPDYGGYGMPILNDLSARLVDVAAGNVQIPDLLKQFDEYVNATYYNAN